MKSKINISLSLATAVLLMAGCASDRNYKKAADTSKSLEETAQVIHESNVQIYVVLGALSNLLESPASDLQPQFKKYDAAVSKLDSLAADVYEQSVSMQSEGSDYFKSWDEDLAQISNEDIRSRSKNRQQDVAARFEKVRVNYEQAKDELVPFVSNLKDMRTVLASDLTFGGLSSIEDYAEDTKDNSKELHKSLNRLEVDFKDLSSSMSTAATH